MFRRILLGEAPSAVKTETDTGGVDTPPKRKVVPKELVITDIPHAVVFALLEYMYTDSTHITVETASELLIAAVEYQLPR